MIEVQDGQGDMRKLSLGHRVLLSRKELGLTQEDLASAAHLSRSYINSIENGKVTNVGAEHLERLATALGVSMAYLLGMTDDPLSYSPDLLFAETDGRHVVYELADPVIRRRVEQVISKFEILSDAQQRLVIELLGQLTARTDEPPIPDIDATETAR